MIWVKRGVSLLIIAAIGFLCWSWFAGPLKVKRDIRTLGAHMQSCTPLEQLNKNLFTGEDYTTAVVGPGEETCQVDFQSYRNDWVVCHFPLSEMEVIGASYADQAENIGFWGSVRIRYSSSDPTPLQAAMNTPACKSETR